MSVRLCKQCFLLVLLLLASKPLSAQQGYRYWNASSDSLRRVLNTQRADTARMRTLQHLIDLTQEDGRPIQREQVLKELSTLTARLSHPLHRAYRLQWVGTQLANSPATSAAALDSLQAAVVEFDAQRKPVPTLLTFTRGLYNVLNKQEDRLAYYQAKLVFYQQRGAKENMAACHHGLGGYYVYRGDYNQAISHYLRAADLFQRFDHFWYLNELKVIGNYYARWGNQAKAIQYLRASLSAAGSKGSTHGDNYVYRSLGSLYFQQRNYGLAMQYANQALTNPAADSTEVITDKALGLVLKSQVLLAQHQVPEAGRVLAAAQHLADSLKLTLNIGGAGDFEVDAIWARYHTARGDADRAEAAWRTAYRKAVEVQSTPLRLAYLRELATHYQQRGQPGPAATYALAAVGLADTLDAAQSAFHVAQYEVERADRAQTARIAGMQQAQAAEEARARRQRYVLWAVLGGAALLVALAAVLYYAFRRSERLKQLVTHQKQDMQAQRDQLDASLQRLRTTQAQLIQKEKMASLGELTAGIAHEIQNPLNFVNNFSEVSSELLTELADEQARPARDAGLEAELVGDLRQNMMKITQHGRRAAGIVKGMLEHSSSSTGERQPTNLNRLCDEYLRLAYQGLRAKDKSFNAALHTDFLADLPPVTLAGADVGRVLLNLFTNAFYAVRQRQLTGEPGYQPQVGVRTLVLNQQVQIQVTDNGTGMSAAVQAKIFQPFFTTKPTGEGTGLGLSLSHDIIAQGHGGSLNVESHEGQGTTFSVALPLTKAD
jgi:signal transduction histidine kinase